MGLIAALMCAALPFLMGTVFLPEIESEGFFTAEETSVIRDLCRAMSLKHGYSFELELDYISPDGKAQAALTSADPRFYEVVDASNIEVSKTLFIKLYRLYRQTECQVNRYSYKDPRNFKRYSALYLESIKTVAIGMEDALCKKDVFLRADFQARRPPSTGRRRWPAFSPRRRASFSIPPTVKSSMRRSTRSTTSTATTARSSWRISSRFRTARR